MPIYDYKCLNEECKHTFDLIQKRDEPNPPCPECGHKETKRLLPRGIGLVFKGSGFYATDYKGK